MSKRPETESTHQAPTADQKAQWESPLLRRAGGLGDILKQTGKNVLSEHDPGVEAYKPSGQQ